jgi:tetratricopeptide (TPR) repeat protein
MTEAELKSAIETLRESDDDLQRLEACRVILTGADPKSVHLLHEVRLAETPSRFAHAMDEMLAERGLLVDLEPFVVDTWFESMIRRIDGFEEVCDVVGYRFMAFSLIIGINLRAVMHNPEFPSESTIEFTIQGEQESQEAPIEDFRKMLMVSLLSDDPPTKPVNLPPNRDEVARLIGVRYLLLSPLYSVRPRKLYVLDQDLGTDGYSIVFDHEGETREWSLERFREFLRDFVSDEQTREPAARGRFATEDVRSAEKALAAGNPERALEYLRDWILFVRNYRLTGSVAQLVKEPDALFARGLLLTGRAYRLLDRKRLSEDLIRFSIQLLPSGAMLPKFYYELAVIMMEEKRYGEAIAPLRHALKLGLPHERAYPYLGEALLRSDRVVGASLVLGELNREGLLSIEGYKMFKEALRKIGPARDILEELGNGRDSVS